MCFLSHFNLFGYKQKQIQIFNYLACGKQLNLSTNTDYIHIQGNII